MNPNESPEHDVYDARDLFAWDGHRMTCAKWEMFAHPDPNDNSWTFNDKLPCTCGGAE